MLSRHQFDVLDTHAKVVQGLSESTTPAGRYVLVPRKPARGTVGAAPADHMAANLLRIMNNHTAALLGGIDLETLKQFLARCTIRTFHAEQQIIQQGAMLDHAFLVLRGAVEVSILDIEGNRVLAHLAQPGEVVGEVELLSGLFCVANCMARPGTMVASFDLPLLRSVIPGERLLKNLARLFHDRLARDNRYHLLAMFYCVEDRIRSHLLSLTTPDNPSADISQADLAAFSGCSRQTVNRTLAQLRDEGIVELGRGRIVVLDRERLQQLAMGVKPEGQKPTRSKP